MDDLRESFSRMKKGIKHRLPGSKRKADKPGAGGIEERIGPPGPLPRPGTPVATGSDREREGDEPNVDDEGVEPSATPGENKSDWKSTASASAKLLLRGVRDSADAFGPLKSVTGGLCFILENCEVWFPPLTLPTTLMDAIAYGGKQASDRIPGTQGQNACRTAL